MGRHRRPYLPGAVFHLTARTLRREHRFTPSLRTAVMRTIGDHAKRTRTRLVAVAVMSNHLHVVMQQGARPLADFMQPILRRLAHRVQRAHNLEGPVFWRPYAARACMTPSYVRNAIVYVHLNPVRAGLADPADYPWTSHGLYAGTSTGSREPAAVALLGRLDPAVALPLFAAGDRRSTEQLRQDYRAFVDWRMSIDAGQEDGNDTEPEPPSVWRASAWQSTSFLFREQLGTDRGDVDLLRPRLPRQDLDELACRVLAAEAPGFCLDDIYGRGGGARATRLRRTIVRRLHAAGFRNVEVARFLGLSESAVSWFVRQPPPR